MAGERNRLLADAFHQVAVGGEHIGRMIDDVVAVLGREMPLGNRHADGIAETLAERAGGGLDAGGDEILRMAGRRRAELAEFLDLVERHGLVAQQVQQRIDQHRAVAGREHEAVAVGPGRIGRIEFEHLREQHRRDVGGAHRQTGMARFGLFHRVHRERANGVGHAIVVRARHWHLFTVTRGWRDSGSRSFCVHGDLSGLAVDSMLGPRVQSDGAAAAEPCTGCKNAGITKPRSVDAKVPQHLRFRL